MPGPQGRLLLGSLLEVRRDRLKFVTHSMQEYGDLICFRMGPKSLYLVNHPEHARHVLCDNEKNYRKGIGLLEAKPLLGEGLLTSDGELWASQRRLLQTAFLEKRMEDFSDSIVNAAYATVEQWQNRESNEEVIDIAQEMVRLTMNVLGSTLFRIDLSADAADISRDLTLLTRWAMSRMTSLWKFPMLIPTTKNRRARAALDRLESLVEKMIREHRNDTANGSLFALMSARDSEKGSGTNEKKMRDEVMTLLLAGHETTAATLTWVWYLLSQHPEVNHRLHDELDRVLNGRRPTLADLPRLTYTKMIVSETLRLYPPVWLLPRKAINTDYLDQHLIPANSDVLVCVYTIHRHPRYWDEADSFDPQRFAPEKTADRASSAYLPFGLGPRTCLGSRFGLMEVLLAVATIAQRFNLRLATDQKVEAEASLTLHPRRGLPMSLHSRQRDHS